MAALPDLTSVYDGEIAGESLNTANRIWQNPRVLLQPPPKRGSNVVVPRSDGEVAMLHREGVTEASLRILFIGDCDEDGAPSANPEQALLDALESFDTTVYQHAGATATLWVRTPGGTYWSGECQPLSFEWGDAETAEGLTTCRSVMRILLPQRLVEVGSV